MTNKNSSFCLDFATDKCVLQQEWKLECTIFYVCALVALLLRSTKLYFYIDYLGKYKILNKSCIFWV